MCVFAPVAHCFDYCSFVVLPEVWERYASCFAFFPLRIALAILGLLWFHINFKIICFTSVKNIKGNLIGIVLNLHIALGFLVTLTILILPVQKCGIFSISLNHL